MIREGKSIPILSAVIPVTKMAHNLENLRKTLGSIETESIEVILVHDVQDELTGPALLRMIEEFPSLNITLTEGIFGNPGDARNEGIRFTTGLWVVFWDADDVANAKAVIESIKKVPVGKKTIIGQCTIYDLSIHTENRFVKITKLEELMEFPGLWRIVFKNSDIKVFPSSSMGEDQFFIAMNIGSEDETYFSPNHFYTYYVGVETQLTRQKTKIRELSITLQEELKFIQLNGRDSNKILNEMVVRQLLTCIKHETNLRRMRHIRSILSVIRTLGVIQLVFILNKVLRQRSQSQTYVSITGGLGNQLFQLAAALFVSNPTHLKNNRPLIVESLARPRASSNQTADLFEFDLGSAAERKPTRGASFLEQKIAGYCIRSGSEIKPEEKSKPLGHFTKFASSILMSFFLKKKLRLEIGNGIGFYEFDSKPGNRLLIGYFQSYKWADEESVNQSLQNLRLHSYSAYLESMREISNSERILAIHMRLGDYKSESSFGILGPEYYQEALRTILKKDEFTQVWLFSDEPNLAKEIFHFETKLPMKWIKNQDISPAETLELFRMCSGYIIANSSFSWWGAKLSYKHSPVVIAPSKWFMSMDDPIDLLPPTWIRVSPRFLDLNSLASKR